MARRPIQSKGSNVKRATHGIRAETNVCSFVAHPCVSEGCRAHRRLLFTQKHAPVNSHRPFSCALGCRRKHSPARRRRSASWVWR